MVFACGTCEEQALKGDILIIGSPIWFGIRSAVAQLVLERLDGTYDESDLRQANFRCTVKLGELLLLVTKMVPTTLLQIRFLTCRIWVVPFCPMLIPAGWGMQVPARSISKQKQI